MNEKEIKELRRLERIRPINGIREKVTLMLAEGVDDLVLFSHWLDEIFGHELDTDALLLLREWGRKEKENIVI